MINQNEIRNTYFIESSTEITYLKMHYEFPVYSHICFWKLQQQVDNSILFPYMEKGDELRKD